ncbi:MAG: hypothetical protein ACE5JT_03505 [Nitrosopumilaceae archaeon]
MAVRAVVFIVFLLPVVLSVVFGAFVLADVLKQSDRELNMWQFKISGGPIQYSSDIKIQNLVPTYSVSQPIEIEILVTDSHFDCGDLYVTVYDIGKSPKQVVMQSGFFGQCFAHDNVTLPTEDFFSEKIDTPGRYEIVVELFDTGYKKSIASAAEFIVR